MAVRVVGGHELGVGLAEGFERDAGEGVADEEEAEDAAGAGEGAGADGEREEEEEGEALEAGLVELRGVAGAGEGPAGRAGLRGLAGEDDGPGGGGGAAPELGVDEVGEAAEEEADRRGGGDGVADAEDGEAVA